MKLELAELKKRLQIRSVLAITLESGRVAVDLVRKDNGSSRAERSLSLALGAESVAADPEKAGRELAALLATNGIRERRCVVCVPAGWSLTTSAEVPGMSDEDLRGYLELRAEREFPIPVSDLRLAHCAYSLAEGKPCATLAALPAKRMHAVERMLEAAGCRLVSLSLGLDGCLPPPEAPAALHFLANGNHVDLVIAAGGGIVALRSLPGPSSSNGANFDALGFSREVRITLGRLPDALRQQVREAHFGGAPISAANLCGEIRQNLQRMGIDSHLEHPPSGTLTDHPAAALGAAEHYLQKRPVVFEFLPPQVNKWHSTFARFDSRRRRWIVGVVVAAILLPIVAFIVRARIASRLESEWNGMRVSVTELETLQQKIRRFRPWFEPAPQTLQALENLTESFPETGEVWAKSIQVSEDYKVTCSGFARSQSAWTALFERLRKRPDVSGLQVIQVRGENPVQFTIIYKWEPRDAK
jgi:hypothetical protein